MKTKLSALFLMLSLFAFAQKRDSLSFQFPEKYELTLKFQQEGDEIIFREWIPKKETFDNYTIIFTQILVKDAANASLDTFKEGLLDRYNREAVGAKFTEVVRELDYVIFTSEVDYYKDDPKSKEAQLYFLTKGETDMFVVLVALKKKKLPKHFIKEWTEVFKNSKFIK